MKIYFKQIITKIIEWEAAVVLRKYRPKIVAITGSVGKTSTKDAVFAVLATKYFVRKSDKSFNSEIGVPLTVLGLHNGWNDPFIWAFNIIRGLWLIVWPYKYPKWLVLEVGVGKPGDMKRLTKWLYADIVIFTSFSDTPVHVEFFNSKEEIFKEKKILFNVLRKGGFAIVNNDIPFLKELRNEYTFPVYSYGFDTSADVVAQNDMITYGKNRFPSGLTVTIDTHKEQAEIILPEVFGRNHIYSALAALSISLHTDIKLKDALKALAEYTPAPGRMRPIEGKNHTLILDDTYNASPLAMESALDLMKRIQAPGRKIVVLGDMLELGKHTKEAHYDIGTKVLGVAEFLIAVGKRSHDILAGAIEVGFSESHAKYFDHPQEAGMYLKHILEPGDIILVKGSQGIRMERIVEALMEYPEHKEKLLVRQEREWKNKP